MYLVLALNYSLFILSFSSYGSSSISDDEISLQYTQHISNSCSKKEDCLDFKLRKFKDCTDVHCRKSLLNFEELILKKCEEGSNQNGCLSQFNFSAAMCADSQCISDMSATIEKELLESNSKLASSPEFINRPSQRIVSVSKKIVKLNTKSPNLKTSTTSARPVKSNSSPRSSVKTYSRNTGKTSEVSVQKKMMNLSQKANEDKCRTIECLEKMESVYSKLSENDKPNVDYYQKSSKYEHIPRDVIQIYINEGPWSPEMISYFKKNQSALGVSSIKYTMPECSNYREEDCSILETKGEWIHKIRNYFGKNKPGWEFAKEMFKLKNNAKHQVLCSLRYNTLPKGKYPFREAVKSTHHKSFYFDSYNPYPFSASTKLDCLKKFKVYESEYRKRLVELGNYPSRSSYSFTELGKEGQIPPPILNYMRGDCHSFIYIPTSREENPSLEWFTNSKNKRVLTKRSYEGLTRNECRFMANQDLYGLNAEKWEEYLFFIGNVPFARFSSKSVPQYFGIGRFQKFPNPSHVSYPTCKITFKNKSGYTIKREHDMNDSQRDCLSVCHSVRSSLKGKITDFRCTVSPGMRSNPMYGFDADIYSEEKGVDLKICEYFNYHWSKKPLRKFLASSSEDCLSRSTWQPIKTAEEYLGYYRLKGNSFYDLEVKFDGKRILDFYTKADCTMGNLSRMGGRVSKYIRSKKVNVRTEEQCYKACLDYKAEIEDSIKVSPVFVSCELGRAAYSRLVLNFKKAKGFDPFIVKTKDDSRSIEEYFNDSFKELWHGYPYIDDLSSDN